MAETKDEIEKNLLETQQVAYPANFYTDWLPKTLLLADWDLKKYTPSEFKTQRFYIEKLLNDGFSIYLWLRDEIIPLSKDNLSLLETDTILKRIRPEYPEIIITTAIQQSKKTLRPENLHVLGPHWFHMLRPRPALLAISVRDYKKSCDSLIDSIKKDYAAVQPRPAPFPIYASDYAKYGDTLIDIIKKHHAVGPQIIIDDKLTPDEHYKNCLNHLQETLSIDTITDYRRIAFFAEEDKDIENFSNWNQDMLKHVTHFHSNWAYATPNDFLDRGLNPLNLRTLGISDSTNESENSLLKTPGLKIKTLLLDCCDQGAIKAYMSFFKQNPNIYQNLENITLLNLPDDKIMSEVNDFLKFTPKTIKTFILKDPLSSSELTFDLRKNPQLSTIDITLNYLTKNLLQTLCQSPVYHLKEMTAYNYQNIAECLENNIKLFKYLETFEEQPNMPWLTTINIITSAATYLQKITITHTVCDGNSKDFPYLPCLKDLRIQQCDLSVQGLLALLKKMPFIKRLSLGNATQINTDDIKKIKDEYPMLDVQHHFKEKKEKPNTQKAPEDTTEKAQVKEQSQTQKTSRKPKSMPKETKNKEDKEANILFVEMLQETLTNLKSMSTKNQSLNDEKDTLKTMVINSIKAITEFLSPRIQSNCQKQYLSDLAISDETLDNCNKIYGSINQLEDELKILSTDYSALCKGLQEEGDVCKALIGAMDEHKKNVLKEAIDILNKQYSQILEKDKELSKKREALKNLLNAIAARKKRIEEYKPSVKKEADKEERDKICANLKTLKEKLEIQPPQTQVSTTPVVIQTPTPVRPRIEFFPVPRQTTQTSPEEKPRELTRDERRALRVAELEENAKDTKREQEHAAIKAAHAGFIPQERVNNNLPKTDIQEPDLSHIQSQHFKMHLKQLKTIIDILKHEQNWSLETQFALLGSLAQLSGLCTVGGLKDLDILRIASRLRNCIYKKHEEVLTEIGGHAPFKPLLSMAEAWYTFLIKEQTASFKDADAVLKAVKSPELKRVYDIEQKFNLDVKKSARYITKMHVYWELRKFKKSKYAEIDAAALDFCSAVTGAELPTLIREAKKGNKQAKAILKECEFMPFVEQIKELGYDSRHRSERNNNLTVLMRELESNPKQLLLATNTQALIFSNDPKVQNEPKEQKEHREEFHNITIQYLVQSLHTDHYPTDGFINLLEGINVHTKTQDGYTLLLAASKNAVTPIEVIKKLLELGANPNDTVRLVQTSNDDFSCVDFAALNGRADILQLFIANEKQPIEAEIWKNAKEMYAKFKKNENPEMISLFEQALPTKKLQCK